MYAETERLVIRDLLLADVRALHPVFSDTEVTRFTSFFQAELAQTHAWVRQCKFENARQPRYSHNCAIALRDEHEVVGWIGCGRPSRPGIGDLDFGYALRRDMWNRGYMTEALVALLRFGFFELGVQSIFGECRPANVASARVMAKAGMTYTGNFVVPIEGQSVLHERYIARQGNWPDSGPARSRIPDRV
jgi:ribosomal-protein-alanine N-acetyltransferase